MHASKKRRTECDGQGGAAARPPVIRTQLPITCYSCENVDISAGRPPVACPSPHATVATHLSAGSRRLAAASSRARPISAVAGALWCRLWTEHCGSAVDRNSTVWGGVVWCGAGDRRWTGTRLCVLVCFVGFVGVGDGIYDWCSRSLVGSGQVGPPSPNRTETKRNRTGHDARTHGGRDAGKGEEDGLQRPLAGGREGVAVGEVGDEELCWCVCVGWVNKRCARWWR